MQLNKTQGKKAKPVYLTDGWRGGTDKLECKCHSFLHRIKQEQCLDYIR